VRSAPPHPRFRCPVCRVFVRGTEAGHCPKCGFVPPTAMRAPEPMPPWPYWRIVAIAAIAAVVVALVVW
jgi:hypothetical protein